MDVGTFNQNENVFEKIYIQQDTKFNAEYECHGFATFLEISTSPKNTL